MEIIYSYKNTEIVANEKKVYTKKQMKNLLKIKRKFIQVNFVFDFYLLSTVITK